MPPKADPENSTVTLLQEHAFIDDVVKAGVRTVDQFGESCPAEGGVTAQVLDAQTEKVLFDARIVETGNVRPSLFPCVCLIPVSPISYCQGSSALPTSPSHHFSKLHGSAAQTQSRRKRTSVYRPENRVYTLLHLPCIEPALLHRVAHRHDGKWASMSVHR